MLLRAADDDGSVVCIGQQAHAWVCGQLARAWALDTVEPHEEVCLAAEQHDLGMAAWDAAPELNADTGRPYAFTEMPLSTHLRLWSEAPRRMLTQSRYAAVLVSMHGSALYEARDRSRMTAEDARAVDGYLASQRALQERLGEGLDREALRRNQRLLWIWDFLSLGLCLGWEGRAIEGARLEHDTIDPWPFRDRELELRVDGRRLEGRFDDERSMHAALDAAPWLELRFALRRT